MKKFFFFFFLRSNVSHVSANKQDRESGVVSLRWTEIPDQNMIINLNLLAATIRSFKMLIDYTLDLTPPFSPCSLSLPKRKRRRRNCFKMSTSTGIVVALANTPSKFFHLHLGTSFLSFNWEYHISIQALDFESLWQFLFCGSTIATSVSFPSMWLACQCS